MKWGDFVMHPVHIVLLTFVTRFRLHSIDNSSALVGYLPVGLNIFWMIWKMPGSLKIVNVSEWGQHLRWYIPKVLLPRRPYRKDVRRNCVFLIRPLQFCSMSSSSAKMRNFQLLYRLGWVETSSLIPYLIVETFQGAMICQILYTGYWLTSHDGVWPASSNFLLLVWLRNTRWLPHRKLGLSIEQNLKGLGKWLKRETIQ